MLGPRLDKALDVIGILFHCLCEAPLQKPEHGSCGFKRGVPSGGFARFSTKGQESPVQAVKGFLVLEALRHRKSLPAGSADAKRRWFGWRLR